MTPDELKKSILQRAIEGKLVEQRPEEGSADELIDQIRAEKSRLIHEGKIKKSKPLPEVKEEELPFEIPDSWRWVRLGECFSTRAGLAYKKDCLDKVSDKMVRVLRGGNICDVRLEFKPDDVMISSEFVKSELYLKKNTIVTPAVTSLEHVGKMGRVTQDYADVVVGGFVLMLIPYYSIDVFSCFLLYSLSSKYFRDYCRTIVHKSGQAFYNLSREKMLSIPIPLPPLSEQRRIVSRLERLLPLCERYGELWGQVSDLDARFPVELKKSVLQLAIGGALVERREEEGDAGSLLDAIRAEKSRLIHEGKIKKSKPLPEVKEEELPFEIPKTWRWVRLGEVFDVRDGTHDTPKYVANGVPLVTSKNLFEGGISFNSVKYISEEDATSINKRSRVEDDDILFAMIGTIGNPVLVKKDREFCIKNMALFKIFDKLIDSRFALFFLQKEQEIMKKKASGGVQSFVSLTFLRHYPIPLPPLSEQRRIVSRLERILPLCERLETLRSGRLVEG